MSADEARHRRPRRLIALLPLALFVLLAGIFLAQLLSGRDTSAVPSALIGEPAPETSLPAIPGLGVPALDSANFGGKVTLVNVWASWCAPCREEHPMLMTLSRDNRFELAGLNYKDDPQKARTFLDNLGNPFASAGADENGRAAIDWGVYGVPETFLVGREGTIRYKHVGPLNAQGVVTLMAEIDKALAEK
jgi:cytochrome c biogenesis protein CcmG, thiol:disulfide interchange protein DsbE